MMALKVIIALCHLVSGHTWPGHSGHIWSQVVTLVTVEVQDLNKDDFDGLLWLYGHFDGFPIWRQRELVNSTANVWEKCATS